MATIQWTGGSGSWGQGTDWSGATTPTSQDNVSINVPAITVTVGAGVAASAFTLSTSGSTLSVAGGTLFTVYSAAFGGQFLESSGLYMASGIGANFNGAITTTGGTIEALAGATLAINGGGSLAGTISGSGVLAFNGGSSYINTGFSSSISSIAVNAQLGFNTNFATANYFAVLGNGSVDLFGHKLTLSGSSLIDGVVGNGTLMQTGTLTLGAPGNSPTFDNGLTLDVGGHVVQSGNISIGAADSGCKLMILKAGQYAIDGNWSINDPSSIGTIVNAGTLAKTGGIRTSSLNQSFSSTGTIKAGIGTLLLNGMVNSVGGVVSGAGTLGVAGGETTFGNKLSLSMAGFEQQSGVLVLNHALAYAGEWDMTGGVLDLNSSATTLTLSGPSNFDGGTLSGYGGTVLLKGTTQMGNFLIGGPNTLTISGTLDQTNNISFGPSSNPVADILAGATWAVEGDSSISGSYGLINNAGTFIDPNGGGTAYIASEFVSTGTVTVDNSILQFDGTISLAGSVTGSGMLELYGHTILQGGLGISVAELGIDGTVLLGGNLTYANSFSAGTAATLNLGGNTLALAGAVALDGGTLTGGGMLSTTSTTGAVTIDGYTVASSTLNIAGVAAETSTTLLNNGTLAIASGGIYTLVDDTSIVTAYGSVGNLLIVAGELLANGNGASTLSPSVDLTGLLQVNNQTLTLGGGGILAGAIAGAGTLALSGGTYTMQSGLAASVGALALQGTSTIDVAANVAYAGYFVDAGTIDFNSSVTLSVSGTMLISSGTTLTGAGTLLASGDTTLSGMSILGGATLDLTGTTEQGPASVLVAGATLMVGAAGVYTLDASQSIVGGGELYVAGSLIAAGDGTSTLNVNIVDAGTISANLGVLAVMGAVSGGGSFAIGSTGTLAFSNGATITASNTVNFAGAHSDLLVQDESKFAAVLANFSAGNIIELYDFAAGSTTGSLLAGGTQYQVHDASDGNILTLSFASVQSATSLYIGVAADGRAAVLHH